MSSSPRSSSPPCPPGWPWSYPPPRPGLATAAGVLGLVTAALTIVVPLLMVAPMAHGGLDLPEALILLGLPCAAGMIAGAVELLCARSRQLLIVSTWSAVAVLAVWLAPTVVTDPSPEGTIAAFVFAVLAAPLPIVTAVLAAQRPVAAWLATVRHLPA